MVNATLVCRFVLAFLLAIITLTGCGGPRQSPNTGYIVFILKRGIGHFSFEYPARYEVANVEVREDLKYTSIDIDWFPPREEEATRAPSGIIVSLAPAAGRSTRTALEDALLLASGEVDYKLFQRFETTVAQVQGYGAVYSSTALSDPAREPHIKPRPVVDRMVFFERGGLIWGIYMSSDSSTAEADKSDFDHMLQTFKVLK